ncbi:MAG: hypothetical protein ACR2PB_08745, partial [Desulfocapsaceae bacterium]
MGYSQCSTLAKVLVTPGRVTIEVSLLDDWQVILIVDSESFSIFQPRPLMTFSKLLKKHNTILSECAVSERLRRLPGLELHPTLFNTPLIYDRNGRQRLEEIYHSYIEVAS